MQPSSIIPNIPRILLPVINLKDKGKDKVVPVL